MGMSDDPAPDAPEDPYDRITRRLGRRNRTLLDGLTAWSEVLEALGWCGAVRQGRKPPLLGQRASAWLGARGHAIPDTWQHLLLALEAVPESAYWICGDQIRVWNPKFESGRDLARPAPPPLTSREAEVLRWLEFGKTGPEIAVILGCAPRTVESHVARLYKKLGVRSRAELLFRPNPPPHAGS